MLTLALPVLLAATANAPMVVNGWHLERRRASCFIEAASDRGTYLKLEHDPFRQRYYLSVSVAAWTQVADRQTYRIGFQRVGSRQPRIEAAGVGVRDSESPRSLILIDLPQRRSYTSTAPLVIDIIRYAEALRLDIDDTNPLVVNVRGLRGAIPQLTNCSADVYRRSAAGPPPATN